MGPGDADDPKIKVLKVHHSPRDLATATGTRRQEDVRLHVY